MIEIEINNQQDACKVDQSRLTAAILNILREADVTSGEISIGVVDDDEMRTLNNTYLQHDYTTDVLSFLIDHEADTLEGELILCGPMAVRTATEYNWPAEDELLLYAVHGCLHLVGLDDCDEATREEMRAAEIRHLAAFGLQPHYGDARPI